MSATTIEAAEIDRFTAMADEWWDPNGKFKPLHKFNPVRLAYIRNTVIGHFGLGFYSAFMVAKKVEIITKSYREGAQAVKWTCDGSPEFTIEDTDKAERGTDIVLYIDDDCKEFLEEARISSLLKKYCSFLPIPVAFGKKKEWKDGKQVETAEDNIINDSTLMIRHTAILGFSGDQFRSVIGAYFLDQFQCLWAADDKFSHVRNIKQADSFTAINMFLFDPHFIVKGHRITSELHHFRTVINVQIVEDSFFQIILFRHVCSAKNSNFTSYNWA